MTLAHRQRLQDGKMQAAADSPDDVQQEMSPHQESDAGRRFPEQHDGRRKGEHRAHCDPGIVEQLHIALVLPAEAREPPAIAKRQVVANR